MVIGRNDREVRLSIQEYEELIDVEQKYLCLVGTGVKTWARFGQARNAYTKKTGKEWR